MGPQKVECGSKDWLALTQDSRMAGACECGNEPSVFIKCAEFVG